MPSRDFDKGDAVVKLDTSDWRILELLMFDARLSISQIARRTKLSRDVVKYRLDKLIGEKIILSFLTRVNLSKLGYSTWGYVHIRFQNLAPQREQEFIDFIRNSENVIFAHSTLGSWDFGIEFFAKDPKHFFNLQKELKEKFGDIIKDSETGSFVEVYKIQYVPPKPVILEKT